MKYKTILSPFGVLMIALLFQGCVYSHVQRPLDINFQETTLGTKVGRASSQSLLWLVAWGNAGTRAAAENGNIKVITHADTEYEIYLFGLYTRVTTVVYGD